MPLIHILSIFDIHVCLMGLNVALTSEVMSRRCLLVAVVTLTNVLPHQEAMPQTQDMTLGFKGTPPRLSVQPTENVYSQLPAQVFVYTSSP